VAAIIGRRFSSNNSNPRSPVAVFTLKIPQTPGWFAVREFFLENACVFQKKG
jgi:hypothetical protein